MCSQYWNLHAEVACPKCGEVKERELQTHWMGEVGSCVNHYQLGEPVDELKGIEAATLAGFRSKEHVSDDFITHCDTCEVTSWVRCGYCEGTGIRPDRPGWVDAGLPCTMCDPATERHPATGYRNEIKDGVRGWWYTRKLHFDCGGRIENGAVIEVWPLPLKEEG